MKRYYLLFFTILFLMQCQNEHKYFKLSEEENSGQRYISFKDTSEFFFNNIPYGISPEKLKSFAGQPNKIDTTNIGGWEVYIWKYENMIAEITNDHIYLMKTNSSKYKTPSGITPGLNKVDILRIFQIDSTYFVYSEKEWQISNPDKVSMVFTFYEKDILKVLEFGIDLP